MKRIFAIAVAALAAATFVGCDGYPYQTGTVLDKGYNDGVYYLQLRTVVTHNEAIGWQPVSPSVYGYCQVGEPWNEERATGCPDGSGGGGGSW